MKGDTEIVAILNEVLTSELTAINQYFVHSKMFQSWGYQKLAAQKREESIEEMRHADRVMDRILFLEGVPNMQRLFPVRVGENVTEIQKADLALEVEAIARLNRGIALCTAKGDNGTRELLAAILVDEEKGLDDLEAQLGILAKIGEELYLADHIRP
ncbi:MAG: bacterioferritin [Planctomycetes bacterium]|nr:bacterioferritin [Planctomycetota bacterium]